MAIFNTVYGGEGKWKPGANTIAYYKFYGNLNDSSGNGNNGTAGGTLSYGNNYVDVSSGYITVPNLSYSTPNTISMWVKRTNTTSGYILDISKSGGIMFRIFYGNIAQQAADQFYSYTDLPSYSGYKVLKSSPTDTNWHLLTFVAGTSGNVRYYDAIQVATASAWSTSSTTSNGTKIGCEWNKTAAQNPGLCVGYFIIENKAWTADEIQAYYNQTKANYGL